VVRRNGEVPISLFAHRAYAAAHGLPGDLAGLARHALIGRPEHLAQFPSGGAALHFGFRCSSDLGLLAALRAELGIGYSQTAIGRDDPNPVPVLPHIVVTRIGVWLVIHEDLRSARRIRVLFDHLAAELTQYVASV